MIAVHASEQVKADFTLTPGEVTQQIEVTSALPVLQTQSSTVGQNITSLQVNDLPLATRNYTFLAQISPGVTQMQSGRVSGTGGFVANGLTWSHNSYILDGIDNNNDTVDYLNGAAYVILTPPDAVQEVNVQTSDFTAEYGRAGSAVLTAETKSGTNQIQGDVWEYFRNDVLDANTWSANRAGTGRPELRYNQFGFTIGGPVVIPHVYNGHNKTFFFGDYQGTRIAQTSLHNPNVPTALERNSGFTNFQDLIYTQTGTLSDDLGRSFPKGAILDPATTRAVTKGQIDPVTGLPATKTGYVRDPFFSGQSVRGITNFATPGLESLMNVLPASRLDPNAIKLLNAYPAANTAGFNGGRTNNFAELLPTPDRTNQFDVRVDHNFSEKDQMFARAGYAGRTRFIPGDFSGPIDNSGFGSGNFVDHSINAALSETHLFSPTMINEARLGYSRLTDNAQPPIANVTGIPQQFGIQGVPQGTGLGGLPYLNISGLTQIGPGEFSTPDTRVTDTRQITENLTKIKGGHTFKGGFEAQFIRYSFDDPRDPRGRMDFRGNYTGIPGSSGLGTGMADLLLTPVAATVPNGINYEGGPGWIFADSINAPDNVRHYYGGYFQDDWKVTPKLTLNLGVRWEFFGQPNNKYGAEANFVPGTPGAGAAYVIDGRFFGTPLSPAFTSQLAKDGIALQYSVQPGLTNTPYNDFAPRVGFAYQIFSKLVMRAAYGIFYAGFENIGGSPDLGTNYPFAVEPAINDTSTGTQTLASQYPTVLNGQVTTLENGLTFVTPNPTSPAFNPKGMSLNATAQPWKTGSTQEWNFSLQYALTQNDSIQVAYVGNHSVHQLNGFITNTPSEILPPGTTTQNYVPFPDFAQNSSYITPNGDAYYYGLQVTYQRRFAKGFGILANYTHSRCMTDFRNILNDDAPGALHRAPYLPGFGVKGDYEFCNDDAPNVLHVSGNWDVPYGRGRQFGANTNRFANALLGGWSMNWILTSQNGFPGTVGCTTSTTADFGCVAFLVPGQPMYLNSGPHGINEFLNPAAFAEPPVATSIGQTDYAPLGGKAGQFHGPSFNDFDFSLFKQFPVNERVYFQLRGEVFNLLNHPNFGNNFSTLNFTNANFAQINGLVSNFVPREAQLALKLYW